MRPTILISCLALASCGANFKPETLVDGLRVLAITAEPPEVDPGQSSALSILHLDPTKSISDTTVVWVGCEPDPIDFNRSACNDTSALLQPTAFATFPPGVRILGFGTKAGYAASSSLFEGIAADDPVRVNGTSGPVLAVVIGEKINPTADDAELRELFGRIERQELQTVMALTRVTVTERAKKNHNPALAAFEADGTALIPNARLQVKAGQKVTLDPKPTGDSFETFELVLPEGTEQRSEDLVAAWYSTGGRFDEARVDVKTGPPATFIAPGASADDPVPEKRTGTIYMVLRDGRGGQHTETLGFYVCDESPEPVVMQVTAPVNSGDPVVVKGTNMSSVLDVVIGGVALTRANYSPGLDAFVGDAPNLPPGAYPVTVRTKACSAVDSSIPYLQP